MQGKENKKRGKRKRIICLVGKKWREGKEDGGNEF